MIRCVVFDFDGTLVDSNAIKRETFYSVVQDIPGGDEILNRIFSECRNLDRYETFALFAKRLAVGSTVGRGNEETAALGRNLALQYTQLCDERVIKCEAIEGAEHVLGALHAEGIKLFVNSATPLDSLKKIISARNLDRYFEGLFGSPESKAANLRAISDLLRISSEDMVMVGDGVDDEAAAEEFGCAFIGVGKGTLRGLTSGAPILDIFAGLPSAIRHLTHAGERSA